jgi:hypothetical protein
MGLKFELILVSLIVITSVYMMSVKLRDHNKRYHDSGKELEFYDTTFTEVNTTGLMSVSYGVKGERINGVMYVDDFRYKSVDVKFLRANKAKDTGEVMYLDGNVRLKRYDGFRYQTEHAKYDKKHEVMEALSPFIAYKAPNTLMGKTMRYDVKRKVLYATDVRMIIVTDAKETNASVKRRKTI